MSLERNGLPQPRTIPTPIRSCSSGSLVFHPTRGAVDLSDYRNWWFWTPGADWRHPDGPDSTLHGRERHPVTQVEYDDAVA